MSKLQKWDVDGYGAPYKNDNAGDYYKVEDVDEVISRLEAALAEIKAKRLRELEEIDNLAKNCLVRDLNDGVAALNQIRNRIKATTKEDV